jgi:hypothetical protein
MIDSPARIQRAGGRRGRAEAGVIEEGFLSGSRSLRTKTYRRLASFGVD